MKKIIRTIALVLALLMAIGSLASCGIIEGMLGNTEQPDTTSPRPHVCESKCHKCQKCLDMSCQQPVCRSKCQGHGSAVAHKCESECEVCGKCLDSSCNEAACNEKCGGHVVPPQHSCESICDICYGCLDTTCTETACMNKCPGHNGDRAEDYAYLPIVSEKMAAIYINTTDGSNLWATRYNRNDKLADRIKYVDATVSTDSCEEEYKLTDVAAEVKVRGNYTLEYEKKPIRIKFSKKNNLLGLHDGEKYKNWVLLADWKDLSMSNNTVAFYLGNTILGSDGYYCTDFRNVEVYLNGQYWGVYLLVEQQEAKDGRSSVDEVEDDYTGNDIGYLFEYDGYYTTERDMPNGAGDPTFELNHQGLPAGSQGYTIKSDIYADSQIDFLQSYMNNVLYIAYQANYNGKYYKFNSDYTAVVPAPECTSAKEAVGAVIDLKSLVGTYILNEIAKDLDVDWSSFYLSLDMTPEGNKKVTFEAPWDFDSCFGIISRENCSTTEGLYAATNANPWFRLVANEEWFWEMVYEKWAEIKEYGVLEKAINLVKTEKEVYKDYYIRNFERWSSRVTYGNDEVVWQLNSYKDVKTAQGLAADYLVNWLTKRFAYLDGIWTQIKVDENLPEGSEPYRLEAEDATLGNFTAATPIRTNKNYASGNSYVGNVDHGTTISFTLTVGEDTVAYLFAGVSKRSTDRTFAEMFSVTINGEELLIPVRSIPKISDGEEEWHSFISIKLAPIQLHKGENTIVFTTISNDATNFDYIEIYSSEEITDNNR